MWDSQGIVWCGGYVSYSKKPRNMAILSYNRNFRLVFEEGLADVDPELLIRLPFNELIYNQQLWKCGTIDQGIGWVESRISPSLS
ncbi:MAG: hypothetical protein F6K65_34410 [Moorea sp. SIO3C2]|nr:hypothetical protein [Moorena sp. SIO3C2]